MSEIVPSVYVGTFFFLPSAYNGQQIGHFGDVSCAGCPAEPTFLRALTPQRHFPPIRNDGSSDRPKCGRGSVRDTVTPPHPPIEHFFFRGSARDSCVPRPSSLPPCAPSVVTTALCAVVRKRSFFSSRTFPAKSLLTRPPGHRPLPHPATQVGKALHRILCCPSCVAIDWPLLPLFLSAKMSSEKCYPPSSVPVCLSPPPDFAINEEGAGMPKKNFFSGDGDDIVPMVTGDG